MPGAQRLFDRFVQLALSAEPAAGVEVQTGRLRIGSLAGAQQIGKQVVITKPAALLVQRYQKHLMRLQITEHLDTVMAVARGVAQLGAKTLQARGVIEKCLNIGRQAVDHFLKQVFANQHFTAAQRLRQGTFIAGFSGRQQPEAQPGHPAFAAQNQAL